MFQGLYTPAGKIRTTSEKPLTAEIVYWRGLLVSSKWQAFYVFQDDFATPIESYINGLPVVLGGGLLVDAQPVSNPTVKPPAWRVNTRGALYIDAIGGAIDRIEAGIPYNVEGAMSCEVFSTS